LKKNRDELLTSKELSERWKISKATLYRMIKENNHPKRIRLTGKENGKVYYRLKDIEDFEESRASQCEGSH